MRLQCRFGSVVDCCWLDDFEAVATEVETHRRDGLGSCAVLLCPARTGPINMTLSVYLWLFHLLH